MTATFVIKKKEVPNMKPTFMWELPTVYEHVINRTLPVTESFRFDFPEIYDPEGGEVTTRITKGLRDWMVHYPNRNYLYLRPPKENQTYKVELDLVDEGGEYNNYNVNFEIKVPYIAEGQLLLVDQDKSKSEETATPDGPQPGDVDYISPEDLDLMDQFLDDFVPGPLRGFAGVSNDKFFVDGKRPPTYIGKVQKFTGNGGVKIYFSEKMYGIKDFETFGMSMKLFQNIRYKVFGVEYIKGGATDEDEDQPTNSKR